MSLNKFLCKYFDTQDRGYVTVGDIIKSIAVFLLIIITAYLDIQGIYFIKDNLYGDNKLNMIGAFGFCILAFSIFILSVLIWYRISDIKITECKRDKNEQQKTGRNKLF
jgi:hypothetical protein